MNQPLSGDAPNVEVSLDQMNELSQFRHRKITLDGPPKVKKKAGNNKVNIQDQKTSNEMPTHAPERVEMSITEDSVDENVGLTSIHPKDDEPK